VTKKSRTEAATDNRLSRPEISSFINWRIIPMHSAAKFQFERVVHEFAQWRAVPEAQRSPAPSWWWQPAFEAREQPEEMPPIRRHHLELPIGSTYATGAAVLIPWPDEFPRKIERAHKSEEYGR
jgi:hypothetical protein